VLKLSVFLSSKYLRLPLKLRPYALRPFRGFCLFNAVINIGVYRSLCGSEIALAVKTSLKRV
jgi:hypothetical protein